LEVEATARVGEELVGLDAGAEEQAAFAAQGRSVIQRSTSP
jgi:hypothetical protein